MPRLEQITEADLAPLVDVLNAVRPRGRWAAADLVDWRRQATDTIWLLARDGEEAVGAGLGVHGWHAEPGVVRTLAFVLPERRRLGFGTALLHRLGTWAAGHGAHTVEGAADEDDAGSIAWLEARGFTEAGRDSTMVLDLATIDEPAIEPPSGVAIVSWAGHPELVDGIYEVACEALPDVPGEESATMPPFADWLANDMQGAGDRPEATFVAVADGIVVGYAKLSVSPGDTERAFHDMTGVRRAWRGRGIAAALKRAEIAWAKRSGYAHLETWNEVRNTPIRILNERYGYVAQPGRVTVRRPL